MKNQKVSGRHKNIKISRRGFLGSAAAAAAFTIVPRHVLGGQGRISPSDKLNIASIGAGGRASASINNCAETDLKSSERSYQLDCIPSRLLPLELPCGTSVLPITSW